MQFPVTYITAGESHGPAMLVVIRGLPAGFTVDIEELNRQLQRRQQGYGRGGRMKIERDQVRVLSGLRNSMTLASPITFMIENKDYANWQERMDPLNADVSDKINIPRPGHADDAGVKKYGFDDIRNVLERASARETAARILAGAVCRQLLEQMGFCLNSFVSRIGSVSLPALEISDTLFAAAEDSDVRCPQPDTAAAMRKAIDQAKVEGDSLGGAFRVYVRGMIPGLGSYVHWDERLSSMIAAEIMGIQAIKGIVFGAGFNNADLKGSEYHDVFDAGHKKITRRSNNAGGLEGGMSNGETLYFEALMKPIPTLTKALDSYNFKSGEKAEAHKERSDTCAVPAASVVAENITAVPLLNALLSRYGRDRWEVIRRRVREDAGA